MMKVNKSPIASKKEVQNLQKYLMSEKVQTDVKTSVRYTPENCVLLGKAYGKTIGVHTDERRTHPLNCNQFVIGRGGTGKTYNFLTSNLLNGTSSAVVFSQHTDFRKCWSVFRQKNIKVHRINLNLNQPQPESRYNPFLHISKNSKTDASVLAEQIQQVWESKNVPEYDPFVERTEKNLLEMLIYYIVNGNVSDNRRIFRTIIEALQDITDKLGNADTIFFDSKILEKYDVTEDQSYCELFNIIKTKHLLRVVMLLQTDLQIFIRPEYELIFIEESGSDNINPSDFYCDQHYLFITSFDYADKKPNRIAGFLISLINRELFHYVDDSYRESRRKGCFDLKFEDVMPRHIQFYIDECHTVYMPDLIRNYTLCRKYNINWTLVMQDIHQLMNTAKMCGISNDEDWLIFLNNTTAFLLTNLSIFQNDKEFVQRCCDQNGGYKKDCCERYKLFYEQLDSITNKMSGYEFKSGNEWIALIDGYPPILCNRLNPEDWLADDTERILKTEADESHEITDGLEKYYNYEVQEERKANLKAKRRLYQ